MRRSLALAIAGAFLVTGCRTLTMGHEVGSGDLRTEDRAIGTVTEVHATQAIVARVTFGSTASLRVTADDNLLDNVTTRVVGSRLDLGIEGSITTTNPITVTLVVPSLEGVSATASGRVEVPDVASEALRLRAESSGIVEVSGQVGDLDVFGSSAGRLDLRDLDATRVTVRLDSAALAWVHAQDRISGDVTTAAILTVVGDPGSVDVTTSTSGQIRRE